MSSEHHIMAEEDKVLVITYLCSGGYISLDITDSLAERLEYVEVDGDCAIEIARILLNYAKIYNDQEKLRKNEAVES